MVINYHPPRFYKIASKIIYSCLACFFIVITFYSPKSFGFSPDVLFYIINDVQFIDIYVKSKGDSGNRKSLKTLDDRYIESEIVKYISPYLSARKLTARSGGDTAAENLCEYCAQAYVRIDYQKDGEIMLVNYVIVMKNQYTYNNTQFSGGYTIDPDKALSLEKSKNYQAEIVKNIGDTLCQEIGVRRN